MVERRVTRQSYVAAVRVVLLVTALALGASAATAASERHGNARLRAGGRPDADVSRLRPHAAEEAGAARARLPRRLRHGCTRGEPDRLRRRGREARVHRGLPGRARARLERRAVLRRAEQARRERCGLRVEAARQARPAVLDRQAADLRDRHLQRRPLLVSPRVRASSRIAAAAPVAATLVSSCSPKKPVSILHVHGLEDENIPFEGGQGTRGVVDLEWPPVEQGIERWRKLDGCPAAGAATMGPVIVTTSVDAVPQRHRGPAGDDCRRWPHVAKGAVQRDVRDLALLRRSRPRLSSACLSARPAGSSCRSRPGRRGDRRSPPRGPSVAGPDDRCCEGLSAA